MDKIYIVILSCAFIVLLHYLRLRVNSNGKRELPPSPRAIPFLGHLHLMKKPFHLALCRLAARHGPVFSLRLGWRSVVVVSSLAYAKECFTENDVALGWHGAHHVQLRPALAKAPLHRHRTSTLRAPCQLHVRRHLRRGARHGAAAVPLYRSVATSQRPVQMKRRLFELALSVLMETMADTKLARSEADADTDMSAEAQEFSKVLDEVTAHIGSTNMWDYLPVMQWFDVFGAKNKVLAAVRKRDVFLQRLIDTERRKLEGEGGSEGQKKSMIAVLLTLQKEEPQVYTDSMIMGLCVTLFAAATGTTSATIEWAMSLLLNHPAVLKKAQDEIDAHVGTSRMVAAEDMSRLTYLQCIISETLRLHPATPLLLPHQSSADCIIGGLKIPSGTMLMVNAYAIHRDPTIWEDPAEFKPDRFEDDKATGLLTIPFGMGRRKCPAEAMALRTIGLAIGALIQCFDWERVEGVEVDMTEGETGFVAPKVVPFQAVCMPRATMCDLVPLLR